jgi:hypothetical protein
MSDFSSSSKISPWTTQFFFTKIIECFFAHSHDQVWLIIILWEIFFLILFKINSWNIWQTTIIVFEIHYYCFNLIIPKLNFVNNTMWELLNHLFTTVLYFFINNLIKSLNVIIVYPLTFYSLLFRDLILLKIISFFLQSLI